MSVYEHILHERDLHGMCPVPPSRCVDESQDSGGWNNSAETPPWNNKTRRKEQTTQDVSHRL